MKRCVHCGAENLDYANFCESCGDPLPELGAELEQPDTQFQTGENPAVSSPFEEGPAVEAPKKSKKGLWIGLGCLAGVLVLGAVVFCWLFAQNPMRKIATAAQKTVRALQHELTPLERLQEAGQARLDLLEANQYSYGLRFDLDYLQQLELYLDCSGNYDGQGKRADFGLSLGVADAGEIQAQVFAQEGQILLSAPQLWDDVFSLDLENFGEKLNEWAGEDIFPDDETPELFGDANTPKAYSKRFEKTCGAALREYIKSLTPRELQQTHEADSTWTYYLLVSQPEKKQALLDCFSQFWKESEALLMALPEGEGRQEMEEGVDECIKDLAQMEDLQVAIDSRGYLVAVRVIDQEGNTVEGKLTGGENPWSAYSFYYNGEPALQGSLTVDSGVLTWKNHFPKEEEQTECNVVYTDATGTFSVDAGMQEPPILTGTLREEDGGVYLELQMRDNMVRMGASMMPLAQMPISLEGPQLDLFNLSKQERERLKQEAMQAVMMDGDLMGLLMWFMGNSATTPFV